MAANRIIRLPDVVANQIAAGEVVERPASVVKELLENSLDAGAGRIEIEISSGGVRRVQVRDDGEGMTSDDVTMSVERHATSKIKSIEDLDGIMSMGFRGEALPSIASVSRFCLISRRKGTTAAVMLKVAGGEVQALQPAAHPQGTTVEVCDLFYNTPARRKFMRTERTESLRIDDVVRRLALANCGTSFRLQHETGTGKNWQVATLQQRVRDILGSVVMDKLVAVEAERDGMRLAGWVSGRGRGLRQATDRQFTFVNGRSLRDRQLSRAINNGCEGHFGDGMQPVWVLFLQLDPATVDVNAHPAKNEVRLRRAHDVFDFISSTMRSTLGGSGSMFSMPPTPVSPYRPTTTEVRQTLQSYSALATSGGSRLPGARPMPAATDPALTQAKPEHNLPHDIIAGRYLVLPDSKELLLLDLVAASTSMLRHELDNVADLKARPLLIAPVQQADEKLIACVEAHSADLSAMALQLEQAGPFMLSLRAVPAVCGDLDEKSFLKELLQQMQQRISDNNKDWDKQELVDIVAASTMANSHIGPQALQNILRQMKSLPRNCWRRLRPADLAKLLNENRGKKG